MAAAEKKSTRVSAVVADGRTIHGDEGKLYVAGSTASLPEEEVDRLRELGFIVKEVVAPVARSGPSMTTSDGPQIKIA